MPADEISEPTQDQDDEIIMDQPIISSQTTFVEPLPGALRRSGRVVRQPARYMENGDAMVAVTDDHIKDTLTLKDAMKDVDATTWQETMNAKIVPIHSNQVWKLVDLPRGGRDRLGANGSISASGAWMEKSKLSIRILQSIAAYLDYEIWQVDVKTTFLNGRLEESICMMQPERIHCRGARAKSLQTASIHLWIEASLSILEH